MANIYSEDKLAKLAEAEILKEAKRGAIRAEMAGPSGWRKPAIVPTNKNFLKNTIRGALVSNQIQDKKSSKIKETKLQTFEEELKERNRYKRKYLHYSSKSKNSSIVSSSKPVRNHQNGKNIQDKDVIWKDDKLEIKPKFAKADKVKSGKMKCKAAHPRFINFVSEQNGKRT